MGICAPASAAEAAVNVLEKELTFFEDNWRKRPTGWSCKRHLCSCNWRD